MPGRESPDGAPPAPGFRRHSREHPGWGRLVVWLGGPRVASSSPPLVLLHGFTGSAHAWGGPLLSALAEARPVIAVDLPGHGSSDWPLPDVSVSLPSLAGLLAQALPGWVEAIGGEATDAAHIRADWLGYSMGARIALTIAVKYPGVVGRLILESGSPGLTGAGERSARIEADQALADSLEQGGMASFVDRWLALPLFAGIRTLPPDQVEEERRRRLANRPSALAGVLRRLGTGTQPDLRGALPAMDIPTLLLAGANDAKFAALAREVEDLLPDGRRVEWPGVGHVPHRELPLERWLREVEDFLSRPEAGQPPPISSRKASP